jgi:hypothetical protein
MTLTEHCPICLAAARQWRQHEDGQQTVTTWRCGSCGHRWQTSYLTAAYGDASDGELPHDPPDDPEDQPGYWDRLDGPGGWDPRTSW